MSANDTQPAPAEDAAAAPAALPDYLTDADAVLKDKGVKWRYGRPPDYSKTRKVYAETKQMNHEAGSLIQLVENLVKNWEIEASFKPRLEDWRTVDAAHYTFAINGLPPQSAEHMLKVGTYNAIIAPNEYYSPENSDFASSHKTFKRMMPTFAWEVIEVYSGPPHVSFRWRHWGTMKNDYVGFNDRGEKVTAKAHGGSIDIQGVTVATVDDKVRLRRVETWFDPMEMFRQIAPQGIVNKEPVARRVSRAPTPLANRTASPELPLQPIEQLAEVLQPVVYNPVDSNPVPPPQAKSSKLQSEEQKSISVAPVDVPPTSDGGNDTKNATATEAKTEHHAEPTVQTLPPDQTDVTDQLQDMSLANASESTQPEAQGQGEQVQQPSLPAHSLLQPLNTEPEQVQEFDQWHEASDMAEAADKFHDAIEIDHGNSTASSEAGSWTAVTPPASDPPTPRKCTYSSSVTSASDRGQSSNQGSPTDEFFNQCPAHRVHPHPKDMEDAVGPQPGEGVAAAPDSEEARLTYLEMSKIYASECPFFMNRE